MTIAERAPQPITIGIANPNGPAVGAMVSQSQQDLLQHFPPEEIFSASQEELAAPNCHVLIARRGAEPVGCVALLDHLNYGEIKRLFVCEACRGMGLARALMSEAEALAGEIGLRVMRLETGHALKAAVRLYRGMGYAERTAFGEYPALDSSLFLEKRLF